MTRLKVYLCGPINGCTDAECKDWRLEVKRHFPEAVDPMKRDYRGKEAESYGEIVELDKRDIRFSDAVLVNYVKPSVGTAMETLYAWELGKPVVLLCERNAVISPWLRYHSTSIVHSVADAVAKISSIAV